MNTTEVLKKAAAQATALSKVPITYDQLLEGYNRLPKPQRTLMIKRLRREFKAHK